MIDISRISKVDIDVKPKYQDITTDAVAIRTIEYDITVKISGTQQYVAATWAMLNEIANNQHTMYRSVLRYDDGNLIIADPASGTVWTYRPIEVHDEHVVFSIVSDSSVQPSKIKRARGVLDTYS